MKHPLPSPLAKAAFGVLAVAAVLGAARLAPAAAPVTAPAHTAVQPTCDPVECGARAARLAPAAAPVTAPAHTAVQPTCDPKECGAG